MVKSRIILSSKSIYWIITSARSLSSDLPLFVTIVSIGGPHPCLPKHLYIEVTDWNMSIDIISRMITLHSLIRTYSRKKLKNHGTPEWKCGLPSCGMNSYKSSFAVYSTNRLRMFQTNTFTTTSSWLHVYE